MTAERGSGGGGGVSSRSINSRSSSTIPPRTMCNMLNMLLSLLVICTLFASTTTAFESDELMFKGTKYTEWSKNITYLSKTSYNARGMKPLYEISHKVMWFLIGGDDPLPDGK